MFHLASTRFNNATLKENMDYRLRVREKTNAYKYIQMCLYIDEFISKLNKYDT